MIISHKIKNLVSILIAVLFLYNSFGYLFLYFPASLLIKYTMHKSIKEKKMDPEDLVTLSFKISELENHKYDFIWKKPGREFRFNGKMYDIEDKIIRGDSVYYTVYYDHKENILEELFSIQQSDNKKDKPQNTVQRVLLVGLYYEQVKYFIYDFKNSTSSKFPLNKNDTDFSNYISDIPTPPPRIIV